MSAVMILLACVLLAVGGGFLARRNWLPGYAILALAAVPLFLAEPFAKALFTWLALVGLMVMVVVFLKGMTGRGRA